MCVVGSSRHASASGLRGEGDQTCSRRGRRAPGQELRSANARWKLSGTRELRYKLPGRLAYGSRSAPTPAFLEHLAFPLGQLGRLQTLLLLVRPERRRLHRGLGLSLFASPQCGELYSLLVSRPSLGCIGSELLCVLGLPIERCRAIRVISEGCRATRATLGIGFAMSKGR